MQQKSLGFDKEQIAVVPYNAALNDKFEAFRNELLSNSNIKTHPALQGYQQAGCSMRRTHIQRRGLLQQSVLI